MVPRGLGGYVGGLAAFVAALVGGGLALPDRVPLHFDLHGDPDDWASRGDALLTMGIIGGAVAVMFGALALASARIPVRMFNVPDRDWWAATADREAELRRRMRTDLFGVGGGVLAFLAVLTVLTTRSARMASPHLDGWFVVAMVAFAGGVLGWVTYAIRVRYRRTEPEPEPDPGAAVS